VYCCYSGPLKKKEKVSVHVISAFSYLTLNHYIHVDRNCPVEHTSTLHGVKIFYICGTIALNGLFLHKTATIVFSVVVDVMTL
jgi:hypothetical protein